MQAPVHLAAPEDHQVEVTLALVGLALAVVILLAVVVLVAGP